jgi:hypothetical protein
MAGLGTERTPVSRSYLPPVPDEGAHPSDIWVSVGIAVVLGLIAATIALWPAGQRAQTASQSAAPTQSRNDPLSSRPPQVGPSAAKNTPTRFTNPFDASEVFEFPPGTSQDAARESVAQMLLERARQRHAQISSVKHMHAHPPALTASSTIDRL